MSNDASLHRVLEKLRRKLIRSRCMAPERMRVNCSNEIISAHTISKASSLKKISADGHVYAVDLKSAKNISKDGVELKLLGINKTSTFNGFCKIHDSSLFGAVDGGVDVSRRLFVELAYRALSKEVFIKEELVYSVEDMEYISAESGMDLQAITLALEKSNSLMKASRDDISPLYSALADGLCGDDDRLVHYGFEFSGRCPIAFSSMLIPEYSADGEFLQSTSIGAPRCSLMTFSCLPTSEGALVAFTFIREGGVQERFLNATKSFDGSVLARYFISLCFEKCENFAVSPAWWNSLSSSGKRKVSEAMNSGAIKRASTEVWSDMFRKFDPDLTLVRANIYEGDNISPI